jgi:xanthine/uracil permease
VTSLLRQKSLARRLTGPSSTPESKAESWYAALSPREILYALYPVQSDGIGGFISALFTVTPLSIFAQVPSAFSPSLQPISAPQNNGVIAITRCANRAAGRWCCVFLILFGILGKISGALLAIPNPVLGGVTTFLFASVAVSGLRVLAYVRFTRRDRFILAAALSFGVGDLLVPGIFTHLFDGVQNPNKALEGFFASITIVLSTPCESSACTPRNLFLIIGSV